MMRSSSRRSLDLSRKGARTIADKRTTIGTAGARRAVTSAVREGQAHGMEEHGHGVRYPRPRPGRSSSAGLVAPDRTFRAAETPGGSHSGSQPNAAPATAPVRSPRHPRVPWLHAPRSPGAPLHAKARPTCSKSISPRGCRTLCSRRPRRACSSRSTSRPSSRRPRAAAAPVRRSEASRLRCRCLHSALGGSGRSK
jgi:hypothetical protein